MKIHVLTIGSPKLDYARQGFSEYTKRLGHYHQLRVTHLEDKKNTAQNILAAAGTAFMVALIIDAPQLSSHQLAALLEKRAQSGQEICFIIGGPDGLQPEVQAAADIRLSFSKLTFPHDLAMVILAETLYRSSTINAGQPYHH